MTIYTVELRDYNIYNYEVEASDEEEAKVIAYELYEDESTRESAFHDGDIQVTDVRET